MHSKRLETLIVMSNGLYIYIYMTIPEELIFDIISRQGDVGHHYQTG